MTDTNDLPIQKYNMYVNWAAVSEGLVRSPYLSKLVEKIVKMKVLSSISRGGGGGEELTEEGRLNIKIQKTTCLFQDTTFVTIVPVICHYRL